MPETALVTGASSGIGAALARVHAARGGPLILAARRAEALDTVKAELESAHGVPVHVFPCDLAAPGGADALCDAIDAAGLSVDILINNAGFGGHGQHLDRDLSAELSMIDLNVKAPVVLAHRLGRQMVARGRGRILNVGSVAGFMPGPQQAVYFATKAFVNSYSQALDHELRGKGVTVTLLTPGYVKTEFAEVADLEGTALVKQGGATAEEVAKLAYDAMMAGDLVVFNEAKLKLAFGWIIPFLPRRGVLKMADQMQAK